MNLKQQFHSLALRMRQSRLGRYLFPFVQIGGLEITNNILRLTFLSPLDGEKTNMEYAGTLSLPPGLIVNGQVENSEALAQEIKKLFQSIASNETLRTDVIVSIPEWHVYSQSFTIPTTLPESAIPYALANEATLKLPFPLVEVSEVFDYAWQIVTVIGMDRHVILCFAKRNIIEGYQKAVEMAGFRPVVMQTPSIGFQFCLNLPSGISVLYFLEAENFVVNVYVNGNLWYKKNLLYKHAVPAEKAVDVEILVDLITSDVTKVKNFILSELGENYQISLFILASSSQRSDEVIEALKKRNVSAEKVLFKPVLLSKDITDIYPWASALGAAHRAIIPRSLDHSSTLLSYSPKDQYIKKIIFNFFSRTTKIIFTVYIFYILSFMIIGFFLFSSEKRVQAELIRQQEYQIPEEFTKYEKELAFFNTTVEKLSVLMKKHFLSSIGPLQAITAIAYPGINISDFEIGFENEITNIRLTGNAAKRDQFLGFKKYLEEQGVFTNIVPSLQSLELRENINFTMSLIYAG